MRQHGVPEGRAPRPLRRARIPIECVAAVQEPGSQSGFEPRTARPGGRVLAAGLLPRFYANSLEVVFGSAGSAKSSLQSAMQSALPSAECSPEVLAVQSRD